ncbi:retrovirus-related pol polyprotein from transposon TNT 1-94 [Tanacetum coccineum]|uniref:Retrovirus-related pol polyprotein from transposon TNT 1-94 n=1 Tax=Tanacetum coccineum TaxID=301880 RepID=A0ABQ5C122_9ASTR
MQTLTSNALHNAIMEAGGKDRPPMLAPGNYFKWTEKTVPVAKGSSETTIEGYIENYKNVSQDIPDQLNAKAEAVQIILTGIDNDIYSTVDACEMWKAIKRLKQGESINVQDLETNLYWEFGKFTSRDGESLESYYSRFVTLVKQGQELKTVSYHKLYDILKQHQNEVNEIRAERLAHTRNNGKAIVNSSAPIYDQEPATVTEDDEMLKEKEIDKLMALISLSFKKIYKPTNNNLQTSSNTSRANQDNSPRINRGTGECQKPKRAKDAAYHKEKMLLCKQEEAGVQLNAEQADWKDDTDDESDDQELEAHYMYMAQIQEVTPDAADNFGPIFDAEPLQKVQNDDDNYNVFDDDREYPEQPESVNEPYPDMCYDREQDDQDDTDELAQERDLLAFLIKKLKCEIDDSKNRNKFLESSNQTLVDKLKDLKKFQAKLDRYHDVNYASKINDLNQTISDMKKELFAHQETISIMSQEKEAQIKFYKTREDKELDKAISLENKVKVLDDIVYKTGKSVQTMNMLNRNCKTSFAKPEFLKKAQRANPRLYDIGCYNDNLALMLAPESDKMIRLSKESRSKLSDLIRPFDYDQLNNLYDLFVPQCEKSPEQHYFSKESKMSHISAKNEISKDSFNKQTTLLEKRIDKSIPWDQKEYYYVDHMNAILGVYTDIDEVSNFQCDYLETLEKCKCLEKELSKSRTMSKSFEALQKNAINLELDLQQCKEKIKMTNLLKKISQRCSKHMTENLKLLTNFVEKFLGTVKFRNDQIASILGYGDLVQGAITIKRVYYVEGLNHNLFSVGQFYDADLEVVFRKSTCYIRDLKGNDLLTGSRGTYLYSITLQDSTTPIPICLMAKATLSEAWLWHRHLSHLNFDTINLLSKNNIVKGLLN